MLQFSIQGCHQVLWENVHHSWCAHLYMICLCIGFTHSIKVGSDTEESFWWRRDIWHGRIILMKKRYMTRTNHFDEEEIYRVTKACCLVSYCQTHLRVLDNKGIIWTQETAITIQLNGRLYNLQIKRAWHDGCLMYRVHDGGIVPKSNSGMPSYWLWQKLIYLT